jgi:drug/metabolite transporter (DMT)-like permease
MSRRATGIALAFVTACISGISVWVNAHAVKHFGDATVYTTAKNAVAGIVLLSLALPIFVPRAEPRALPARRRQWLALAVIAAIGGSIPFVLFFEGLARADATQAAFIHKTLVVWVALLAVPLLRERLGPLHYAAIGLVIVGQAALAGDLGTVAFGAGEVMIFAATLLWAVEVIVAKSLLDAIAVRTVALARMGLGTILLLCWVTLSGRASELVHLSGNEWSWAILTGLLLSGYVATWYAALARAQAVDVTAVLVFGAVVTAVLANAADGAPFDSFGIVLISLGAVLAALAGRRPRVGPA